MNRMTAKDFDQELLDLYGYYIHGKITKREFLDRAGRYAVGGVTAIALLNMLKPNYAMAEQVSFNDPDIKATFEIYESPNGNGEVKSYVLRPAKAEGKLPAVLMIHENRGLNPYIKDVARRVAKAGFMAMAPDGLTSLGGYPGNDEDGKALQRTVDRTKLMNDFFAGYEHLAARPDSTGKVGAPDYEAALKANGKTYEAHVYEGANHGFHNDSMPRFDEKMANLAWDRTIDWFNKYLI